MAKTLDRTRPFGESFGGSGPERFHQDDSWFDAEGNEIVSGEAAADEAAASPARSGKGKNAPAADDQVNKQLGA